VPGVCRGFWHPALRRDGPGQRPARIAERGVERVSLCQKAAKLSALRAAIDAGIAELDAGLGVETTPEKLMAEVFAELRLEP
jgi:hypothetical protein